MKEIISEKQATIMMMMFIIGSTLVVGGGGEAKQDAWIALIIGLLGVSPILAIYARIIKLFPEKSIYDIFVELFGKFGGKVITCLFTWYSFHLGSLVIRNFSEFITTLSLPETPQYFIQIVFAIICIWVVKNGIEVLGRWSEIIFIFLVLIIIFTLALSFTQVDFSNLKPILYEGIKPVLKGAYTFLSFPFAESVIFLSILFNLRKGSSSYRVYFLSSFIIGFLFLVVIVRNITLLGMPTLSLVYFPSYEAISVVKVGEFIQRFEIVVSTIFLICGILKVSICLLSASQGLAKVFSLKDYRILVVPIGLLMFNLSTIIYTNTKEMFDWVNVYKFYAIPFQLILPLAIWIMAEIKKPSRNLNK